MIMKAELESIVKSESSLAIMFKFNYTFELESIVKSESSLAVLERRERIRQLESIVKSESSLANPSKYADIA